MAELSNPSNFPEAYLGDMPEYSCVTRRKNN